METLSFSGYKSLSILKLDDMIKLRTALFVHRHFNKKLPTNLQSYFTNVNTCHSIATRRQACGLDYHILFIIIFIIGIFILLSRESDEALYKLA